MPDPAAARFWLTIGVLDARAVTTLREVLSRLAAQPGIGLTIDLTTLDGQHHLTAGALLSAAAHTMWRP
jgi:energy-converting hydrogenase Eha subunit B